MKYFITSLIGSMLFGAIFALSSCTTAAPSGGDAALTDAAIFDIAKQTQGYTWYKNSDAYIGRTPKSGHSEALMRTRYNTTAAAVLDASGKVRSGTTFPEGSIITKELVNADRSLSGYAVMLKRKNDPSADADGWVWGYVTGSGAVRYAVANKGAGCIGCHSIAGHIDRTLMNVSVP
jgi:hypothetical protein